MCPFCLFITLTLVSGSISASGLCVALVRKGRAKQSMNSADEPGSRQIGKVHRTPIGETIHPSECRELTSTDEAES
jgi:hypothetical protein